jgi:16S rRNA (guanine527-N7)-methyltransferase
VKPHLRGIRPRRPPRAPPPQTPKNTPAVPADPKNTCGASPRRPPTTTPARTMRGLCPGILSARTHAEQDSSTLTLDKSGTTPSSATAIFGARLPLAERYVVLLGTAGLERGLIGPREAPRIWERHILNCAVVHPVIASGCSVADVGSGAGLPGVVLAIARPDLAVTLVEPMQRRTDFLTEVIADLGLSNISVRRARAEALAAELVVDVVTARAVAPLLQLARWTFPLLFMGGRLLALKGRSVVDEVVRAAPALREMGAVSWQVGEYGAGIVDPPTRVAIIEVGARIGQAVPRRRTKGRR